MIIAVSCEQGEKFSSFVYFRIENGAVHEREEVPVAPGGTPELIAQLLGLEVDMLISGKTHPDLTAALMESGIMSIRDVSGRADSVMAAYLKGDLEF